MVAGGVGLAPFATLAEALKARGAAMTLFYGARSGQELYYEEFFEALGARIVLSTEDGSRGHRGRVTEPLTRELAEREGGAPVTLYVCGPTPMMRAVAGLAARNDRAAFVSLEPVMGCGMGGCYSCVIPVQNGAKPHFVRSCLEGPVFDAAHVVWDNLAATGH
jgi:dihydroorotate dehydrogenase electron transfer subunit